MTTTGHDPSTSKLPDGWQRCTLGSLVTTRYGKALEKARRFEEGPVPVVGSAGRMAWTDAPLAEDTAIVVGRKGNVGEVQLFIDGVWPIDTVYFFDVPDELDPTYFFHHLVSKEMRRLDSSTSTPSLRREDMERVAIEIPPLAEQQQIVEILEGHLSRLDAALQHIQTLRGKASQFRRSLLHAAFTGALTGHDPSTSELPYRWGLFPLADLLAVSIGGVWGSEEGESEVDVNVIRVTELKPHGVIDPGTAARRSITRKQLVSRRLSEGDLLLEKSGGGPKTPVGRVGMVPSLDADSVCANFMLLMRVNPDLVNCRLLHLFLNFFHSGGGTVEFQTATTNIRNIKTADYLQVPIPVPLLAEQARIVEILEGHLSRLDAAMAVADAVEERAGALRRSLLHAAFTGKLTEKWREQAHV